ncbi:hypothetical protein FFLO_06268 [Filobasidium floriforme]|uniref:Response regulatory domain-containing protein n=1 Tax=Filobasidium floriforme TaxID=5210 RepID=A0A8K0NKQ0_9TREE|nr:hypothetical protein FFLO_06268 [Filobasidium floriforme]
MTPGDSSDWARRQSSESDVSEGSRRASNTTSTSGTSGTVGIGEEDQAHGQPDDGVFEDDYGPPVFNRTYSCPLPARVAKQFARPPSRLRQDSTSSFQTPPLTTDGSGVSGMTSDVVTPAYNHVALQTLSSELSDSLQSAIQTLLHLSPPHLLDNAKEQYSGCTVQMPTTSLSALLTAMKGLNYLSANVASLCEDMPAESPRPVSQSAPEDFDIGELLQSTADLLGGQAAQAGVEIVLFHGDVGIKHTSVSGDGEGLGYALSYVIRQILQVCRQGDTLELGLQVTPQSPSLTPRVNMPLSATEVDETKRASQISVTEETGRISPGETLVRSVEGSSGPLLCTIEIVHTFAANQKPSLASTPRADRTLPMDMTDLPDRLEPDFDGLLCRRIVKHVNAVLRQGGPEQEPSYFAPGQSGSTRTYELSVLLARGEPINETTALSAAEQAARQPFPSLKLDREPTLLELSTFASTLRGKKVELHASLMSIFARHLTSYLAAWGMDVSHIPIEDNSRRPSVTAEPGESTREPSLSTTKSSRSSTLSTGSKVDDAGIVSGERFVIIDDDVAILKAQLIKLRSESLAFGGRPRTLKRPSMASRTRSSPHVRTLQAEGMVMPGNTQPTAVIHFTSLAKYNHVRDVVAGILASSWSHPPEIMVIPKPVGPRRFLTALHTAVQRPLVDPFFAPIATSPRSPGGGYFPPFAVKTPSAMPFESPLRNSHGTDYLGQDYTTLSAYRRGGQPSPSYEGIPGRHHDGSVAISTPGGEYVATPAGSYFARPVAHGSASAAQGVFVRNASGMHMGVFFDPSKPESKENRRTPSNNSDGLRRKTSNANRNSSGGNPDGKQSSSVPPSPARRLSGMSSTSSIEDRTSRRGSTLQPVTDEVEPNEDDVITPSARSHVRISSGRRRVSGESIGNTRERSSTLSNQKDRPALRSYPSNASQGEALLVEQVAEMPPPKSGKAAASKAVTVVPPINVLIVEDNPINQNILSMFLRKRRIKHQTANNGQEAVDKWKTGIFHLILMDIQLPVMDGIEATKLIRTFERNSNIGFFPSTPGLDSHKTLSPVADLAPPGTPLRSSVIIVALTASSFHQDRVNALAAGCNDFLTKPVSLKWLESKIIEWGCMQALIDFEGWRRWKSVDARDKGIQEAKKAVQSHSVANAKNVADKLRLPKKISRTALSDEERSAANLSPGPITTPLGPDPEEPVPKAQGSMDSPASSEVQHVMIPAVSVTSPDEKSDSSEALRRPLSVSSPLAEPPTNAPSSPALPSKDQPQSSGSDLGTPSSTKSIEKPLPPLPV